MDRDLQQYIESLERHIECNQDMIKRYYPQSVMVENLKRQQTIWLGFLDAARETQRKEEPWRLAKEWRLKRRLRWLWWRARWKRWGFPFKP